MSWIVCKILMGIKTVICVEIGWIPHDRKQSCCLLILEWTHAQGRIFLYLLKETCISSAFLFNMVADYSPWGWESCTIPQMPILSRCPLQRPVCLLMVVAQQGGDVGEADLMRGCIPLLQGLHHFFENYAVVKKTTGLCSCPWCVLSFPGALSGSTDLLLLGLAGKCQLIQSPSPPPPSQHVSCTRQTWGSEGTATKASEGPELL